MSIGYFDDTEYMPILLHTLEYIDSMTYTLPIFFRYDILINMYTELIIDWLFQRQYKITYNDTLFG